MENKVCAICKTEKPIEEFSMTRSHGKSVRFSYCKPCAAVKHAEYWKANKEQLSQARKEWLAANPGYYKRWNLKNPDKCQRKNRKSRLKRRGMTPEFYDALLVHQGGGCALCGAVPPGFGRLCYRLEIPDWQDKLKTYLTNPPIKSMIH